LFLLGTFAYVIASRFVPVFCLLDYRHVFRGIPKTLEFTSGRNNRYLGNVTTMLFSRKRSYEKTTFARSTCFDDCRFGSLPCLRKPIGSGRRFVQCGLRYGQPTFNDRSGGVGL
jgi:hypothetical protein